MPSIAVLDGPFDKEGKSGECNFEELCASLSSCVFTECYPCQGKDCPHKKGRAWAPVRYRELPAKHEDQSIAAVTYAVFDLDDPASNSLKDLALKLEGFAYFIHQTHRGNGYRVVLPLVEEIPAEAYSEVWPAMLQRFGLEQIADETCKNVSRIYFLPTRPRGTEYKTYTGAGSAFNWKTDLDLVLPAGPESALLNFKNNIQLEAQIRSDPNDPRNLQDGPVDLETLRNAVRSMRRPESRNLLDTILSGRRLTESYPKDVGYRDTALARACSLIATAPVGKPFLIGTAIALLEPSIRAMDLQPEGEEYWIAQAREKYTRALGRRLEHDTRQEADKAAILKVLGQVPGSDDWRKGLIYLLDKDGAPAGLRQVGANADLIFEHDEHWKNTIRFNDVTKDVDVFEGPMAGVPKASLHTEATNWLARSDYRLFLHDHEVGSQLLACSRRHSYDPLREYLLSCPVDSTDRVSTFFQKYFGATGDEEYLTAISKCFLISCVARAMDPGCAVHTVPILISEGKQGIGKSRSLAALGGEFFTDTKMIIHDKDSKMLAAQSWIIELAELASIKGADIEAIKSFVSESATKLRPPYGRVLEPFKRRCVFVGTSNESEILADWTGNRRWWPVNVKFGNVDAVAKDRNLIFGQALKMYQAGVHWYLTEFEQVKADEIAKGFRRPNTRAEQILHWYLTKAPADRPRELTSWDLINRVFGVSSAQVSINLSMEVGRAAKELGFTKHRKRQAGKSVWVYAAPEEILLAKRDDKPSTVELVVDLTGTP